MSIDRAATLRQAEKLLRQGKLEQAIAEYLRLVEDQPRDWNAANLLGDLFVRAGQLDRAVEQFSRIAESLRHEGFLPKASALYKKILKLKPDADHALIQAAELAAQQGLLADARTFFTTAASGRRQRGNSKGALEVVVRLGSLDREDIDTRLAGAHARLELDDIPGALHEFNDVATLLLEQGRDSEALDPLRQVARLDPGDANAARALGGILMKQGLVSEAATYLTAEAVGADLGLMRVAAEMRLRKGDTAEALEMVDRLLLEDSSSTSMLADLATSLAAEQPETAYMVADRVVGACVARGDWAGAADILRRFVARAPHHVPALTRLVDVCIDAGLQEVILEAQASLADAYLASGSAAEARYVAEDLVTRQPWDRSHLARLRAALEAQGELDPDRALADWLAGTPAFGIEDDQFPEPPLQSSEPPETVQSRLATSLNPHAIDLELVFGRPSAAPAQADPPQTAPAPAAPAPVAPASASVEEDLSVVLDEIPPQVPPAPSPPRPADIEDVFAQLREEAAQRPADESADIAYTRGAAMFEAGELEDSAEQLRIAARSPRRRFAAASLLARIHEQQKRPADAIEWLGHAIDSPAPAGAERFDALFRLADLLEISGEPASALAVCLELQADAGNYKDLAVRIARLSRAQSGG